jgi:hypothetical protein
MLSDREPPSAAHRPRGSGRTFTDAAPSSTENQPTPAHALGKLERSSHEYIRHDIHAEDRRHLQQICWNP